MEYFNYNNEDIQENGLKPAKWMLSALTLNPEYCLWSPYEGYLAIDSDGWAGRLILNKWNEFVADWPLDYLNEIVHFYFEVHRKFKGTIECDLGIALWVIHPRHSCSRGIHIKAIQKSELENVLNFLKMADENNRKKFSKLY